jgi:colanic acid/amylovoran biosynthesis glycosyltransferase
MLTVAYFANEFPSAVEPYVGEEIAELRRRGVRVITGSVREAPIGCAEVVIARLSWRVVMGALWLCLSEVGRLAMLLRYALTAGRETPWQRLKALLHTFLGACYAVMLRGHEVEHIHVHHGYFGSWIGMTAARLLGIGFSMTLHGSDLLLHGTYLEVKLANCDFCFTISEFNRNFILRRYPAVDPRKIFVVRLGVRIPGKLLFHESLDSRGPFTVLAVGRLHAVKDHAFLVRGCAELRHRKAEFRCFIAGEGSERGNLAGLIRELGLQNIVTLLGHVPREKLDLLYDSADVIVLTSRSEGIPLVLMEAMARGRLVLAPAITGIPELVIHGKTGFLYEPGSGRDFVKQLVHLRELRRENAASQEILNAIRQAAVAHVRSYFEQKQNLEFFAELFLEQITRSGVGIPDENFVLQQI